jgi:exopolysaccharide biosynthesis polyprenyl glycosylphosphotransferase
LKLDSVSRAVVVIFAFSSLVTLILVRRLIIWWYMSNPSGTDENHLRVLIVGSGRRARLLADQLPESSEWGVHIVGYLDPKGESAGRRATDEILGHVDEISKVLRDNVVDDVIVAVPRSMLGDVQTIIDSCQEEGVRLRFMADFYDFEAARTQLHLVSGIPLLSFEPVAQEYNALLIKRIFDLVITLAALPVLVPFFLIVGIVIRIDSKGPVIFTQERVGLHKRKFRMYKFRSMVQDAEVKMKEVEHLNEADGPNFKIRNDPRITRIGRFIRKTSIDELPQLFNVLSGDMSLVGPRPMSVRDVNLFDKGVQRRRFSVRPGITCLWQVSGRSDLSFDDWLKLDLQYIDSWSFALDVKILLKTIPVVLTSSGAV